MQVIQPNVSHMATWLQGLISKDPPSASFIANIKLPFMCLLIDITSFNLFDARNQLLYWVLKNEPAPADDKQVNVVYRKWRHSRSRR